MAASLRSPGLVVGVLLDLPCLAAVPAEPRAAFTAVDVLAVTCDGPQLNFRHLTSPAFVVAGRVADADSEHAARDRIHAVARGIMEGGSVTSADTCHEKGQKGEHHDKKERCR